MATKAITSLEFSGSRVAVLSGPRSLALSARAGKDAVVRVRVTNRGDTPLKIDPDGMVALRAPDALARGVRETFKKTKGDLTSRLIALGKQLESDPVTEASIAYKAEFEQLEPGQTAQVEIHLHLPEDAATLTEWRARLPLFGSPIEADVKLTGGQR